MQENQVIPIQTEQIRAVDMSGLQSEYMGVVEDIQSVNVKPQVSGVIQEVCFKEGSVVKEGDLLFKIKTEEFDAECKLKQAKVDRARADITRAERYLKRIKAADEKAVSAYNVEKAECDLLTAKADLHLALSDLKISKINRGYCMIRSPINGKAGKALFTKGNHVSAGVSELVSIVQTDPIRISYTMSDKDYLNFQKEKGSIDTKLILSNGDEITMSGSKDFDDNKFNRETGTIQIKLRYVNRDGKLIPGEIVRVLTQATNKQAVLTVPKIAVTQEDEKMFVFRVKPDNIVEKVYIETNGEAGDSFIVKTGLILNDKVAVSGLKKLKDGMAVQIKGD